MTMCTHVRLALLLTALLLAHAAATGALAQSSTPEFADFTAVAEDSISGTLLGSSIAVTGSEIDAQTVDGTATWFKDPWYTPPLPTSDAFQIHGFDGWSFTISFGAPVKDPVVQLNSLGSTLVFPAGTQIELLNGQAGLNVSGSSVVGSTFTDSTGQKRDTSGTVRLDGIFETVRFSTATAGFVDGIIMTVGATRPPDASPQGGGGDRSSALDSDGDHVTDDADCAPTDPAIHPGAVDTPADGVDQDCDRRDTPMPEVKRNVIVRWGNGQKATIVLGALSVRRPRIGDTITFTCRGWGCGTKRATIPISRNKRQLSLLRFVKSARLHRGSTITVQVDNPDHISRIVVFRVRRSPKPPTLHIRCLAPGAPHTVDCRDD